MSLQHLQLPPHLIANWYQLGLYNLAPSAAPEMEGGFFEIQKGNSGLLVAFAQPNAVALSSADTAFLKKLLQACKVKLAETGLINVCDFSVFQYTDVIAKHACSRVLLFQLSAEDFGLPLHFPLYQVQAFNGVTYLPLPALASLASDVEEKRKAWESLQRFFEV